VAREIIRTAIARTYDLYYEGVEMRQVIQWFDLGGQIQFTDTARTSELLEQLQNIQGLMEKLGAVSVKAKDAPEVQVSAAEFVLEGLHAHKRIGRSEERVFMAGEKQARPEKRPRREDPSEDEFFNRNRRPYN
jgi:magnesium chelatase subunit I